MVQRTVLDVLPMLKPMDERLISLWPAFLRQLIYYLPGGDSLRNQQRTSVTNRQSVLDQKLSALEMLSISEGRCLELERRSVYSDIAQVTTAQSIGIPDDGNTGREPTEFQESLLNMKVTPGTIRVEDVLSPAFHEKCIPLLVQLYLESSLAARVAMLSDVISALGRYAQDLHLK